MFGEKTSPIIITTVTNLATNVLVEDIIICNLLIYKPYESITTMQLILTGTSRTCMFINLCNSWEKTSPIIIKATTTKLATMYW